ncbi:SGNH/GDSL hydrolase family protein [Ornithinibacillus californiensis]|uniref:SGNH/GDSL hydrolase family protein n=1 Tax=Ornithinibacillus californiensis TaxID=161536 RepID=UPI00064DEBC3|nr:SGNH/GDSL hydrolase family protein [Ornithinibacillus californiensis]
MRKKTIIMTVTLVFLIVFGIGVWLYSEHDTSPISHENMEKELQEHSKDPNNPTEDDEQTNIGPLKPAEEISKEFGETIQSTIQFFTGKQHRIVAIGDSLTQGVGDNTGQGGYVGILDKHLNADKTIVTIENYGKRGNRTNQLLKRMEDPEIKQSLTNADIIIITIGANDIMQVVKENFTEITYEIFSEERGQYEERLRKIFSTLQELNPDASVYLVGFYNPFQQYFEHIKELEMIVDDWNHTSNQVANDYGAIFIPTKDLFVTEEVNLFADDHFHPNEYGYRRMAERILNYLVVD